MDVSIVEELSALEQRLLDPSRRADAAFLRMVLSDDFVEIGQSGRRYDKASVLMALAQDPGFPGPRTIADFEVRQVAPDLFLAIYRIKETGTERSSLWRKCAAGWEMVFNQGTPTGPRAG